MMNTARFSVSSSQLIWMGSMSADKLVDLAISNKKIPDFCVVGDVRAIENKYNRGYDIEIDWRERQVPKKPFIARKGRLNLGPGYSRHPGACCCRK